MSSSTEGQGSAAPTARRSVMGIQSPSTPAPDMIEVPKAALRVLLQTVGGSVTLDMHDMMLEPTGQIVVFRQKYPWQYVLRWEDYDDSDLRDGDPSGRG